MTAAAAALLVSLSAAGSWAQGTNEGANAGSPLPGGGTTKDLTKPGQGGVADTGLGGSTDGSGNGATAGKTSRDTDAAGVPGTGMSVKGPAGQGLAGQGVPDGSGASADVSTGRTSGTAAGGAGSGAVK